MTNTKNDNVNWLLNFGYFKDKTAIEDALQLVKFGDDTEPYLSNRLIRIMGLTSVTTAATSDSSQQGPVKNAPKKGDQ